MPTIGTTSKPAYVYDAGTDTWIPIGPGEHTHDYAASAHNHDSTYIAKTLVTTTGDIIYASAANTPARLGIGSTDQVLKVSGGVPVWGAAPSPSFVGCSIYSSANQSLSNNTGTILTFDSEEFDTNGFHSTVSNTSRITIPTGKGGKYKVTGVVIFADNATGFRSVTLRKNGATLRELASLASSGSVAYTNLPMSMIVDCNAGDYLELLAKQASGGNLNVINGTDQTVFQVTYLGA